MLSKFALVAFAASVPTASADTLAERACPDIHIFGARETTAPAGYGTAGQVVSSILASHPGATAEAINYPACGGQSACGGIQYAQSVQQGTAAVLNQVRAFAQQCPNTKLVLVGYSQGGEIFDNALCNQGSITSYNIKAAIFMGDPRFRVGSPFNVGTCQTQGFDARPAGQQCGSYNARVQSYCDSADPYCCTGNDPNTHQGYAKEYGSAALSFVNSHLS